MHLVVDADKRGKLLDLKELLHYKDLFYILAYRDLRVRYAQTFLGLLWAFLQLLAMLATFTVNLSKIVRGVRRMISYSIFAITGITAITHFAFVMKELNRYFF